MAPQPEQNWSFDEWLEGRRDNVGREREFQDGPQDLFLNKDALVWRLLHRYPA